MKSIRARVYVFLLTQIVFAPSCANEPHPFCNRAQDCLPCIENAEENQNCENLISYCNPLPLEERVLINEELFVGQCAWIDPNQQLEGQCSEDFTITDIHDYRLFREITEDIFECDTLVGNLTLTSNEQNPEAILDIELPNLVQIENGDLTISSANVRNARFPNLTQVDSLIIEHNQSLRDTNFSSLHTANLRIVENQGLYPIELPALSQANDIQFRRNDFDPESDPNFSSTISLPSIERNANFIFQFNSKITHLHYQAPRPEIRLHLNQRFSIDGNPDLQYADVQNLRTTGICRDPEDLATCTDGRIEITGNPELTRATFHDLEQANELWIFNNNRLPVCFGVDIFLTEYFNGAEIRTFLPNDNGPCQ